MVKKVSFVVAVFKILAKESLKQTGYILKRMKEMRRQAKGVVKILQWLTQQNVSLPT